MLQRYCSSGLKQLKQPLSLHSSSTSEISSRNCNFCILYVQNWLCRNLMMLLSWYLKTFVNLEGNLLEGECVAWSFIALMLQTYGRSNCKRQSYLRRPSPGWWGWLSRMLRWLLWTAVISGEPKPQREAAWHAELSLASAAPEAKWSFL